VVIAGVTFGGLAALVAGAAIKPPVDGVIDLSSQAQTSGLDGLAAAAKLTVPTLYVDSADDEYTAEIRQLLAATRARDKRLELIPGASHGLSLLDPEQEPRAAEVRALVLDWIRARTS
jgi:pimeloyl-ACP methyl ester carboxylesterase